MVAPNHPLFQAAMQLSPADRLDFAEQLMMTVDEDEAARIDAAIARECEDRLAAYKRGELVAEPADDLLAALKEGRCP